jgi:hypothetical protein
VLLNLNLIHEEDGLHLISRKKKDGLHFVVVRAASLTEEQNRERLNYPASLLLP